MPQLYLAVQIYHAYPAEETYLQTITNPRSRSPNRGIIPTLQVSYRKGNAKSAAVTSFSLARECGGIVRVVRV